MKNLKTLLISHISQLIDLSNIPRAIFSTFDAPSLLGANLVNKDKNNAYPECFPKISRKHHVVKR